MTAGEPQLHPKVKQLTFDTIPDQDQIDHIVYTPTFPTWVLCPVEDKPYLGSVEIEYEPQGELIEYVSFDEWLLRFSSRKAKALTIEQLTGAIFDGVSLVLGDGIPLKVTVAAHSSVHGHVQATKVRAIPVYLQEEGNEPD